MKFKRLAHNSMFSPMNTLFSTLVFTKSNPFRIVNICQNYFVCKFISSAKSKTLISYNIEKTISKLQYLLDEIKTEAPFIFINFKVYHHYSERMISK